MSQPPLTTSPAQCPTYMEPSLEKPARAASPHRSRVIVSKPWARIMLALEANSAADSTSAVGVAAAAAEAAWPRSRAPPNARTNSCCRLLPPSSCLSSYVQAAERAAGDGHGFTPTIRAHRDRPPTMIPPNKQPCRKDSASKPTNTAPAPATSQHGGTSQHTHTVPSEVPNNHISASPPSRTYLQCVVEEH